MKFVPNDPPRRYEVGFGKTFEMSDCGRLELEADEQVTLTTPSGGEYDLARKKWGFYATPSLNGRLLEFGLRGVLVRNRIGRYYVLLVERSHENDFEQYRALEELEIVTWLDTDEALEQLGG
jgi:hypothetical protein